MSLASMLPYTHPFAGGYPYRGSQRLPSDPDALTYLAAVAAADGAPVETAVAVAVDDFFKGCKADGIWDAIKASCILCGARTLAGALVPLVGTAPTNVADGFVAGDYTRGGATPGLKGDGTSYLDSGRANDADGQNDQHLSVYLSSSPSATSILLGSRIPPFDETGSSQLVFVTGQPYQYRIHTTTGSYVTGTASTGFFGAARSESSANVARYNGTDFSSSEVSETPNTENLLVYNRQPSGPITDARLAFYSIGTAISDLALLDARVTALITAIGAAV